MSEIYKANKDWIVREIRLSADARKFGEDRVQYPYFVIGTNVCGAKPEEFSWFLPQKSLEDPRYDLSGVTVDERNIRPAGVK